VTRNSRSADIPFHDTELEEYARILDSLPPSSARKLLPTAVQLRALKKLIEVGRPLIYCGYNIWSFRERPSDGWSIGIETIRAMEKRGWLRRTGIFVEEWKDTRELTPLGKQLPLTIWQARVRGDSLLQAVRTLSSESNSVPKAKNR